MCWALVLFNFPVHFFKHKRAECKTIICDWTDNKPHCYRNKWNPFWLHTPDFSTTCPVLVRTSEHEPWLAQRMEDVQNCANVQINALKCDWIILPLHGLSPLGKFSLECSCSSPNFHIEKPIKRCARGYLDVLCIFIIPRNNRGGRSDLNMGRNEGRAGEQGRSVRLILNIELLLMKKEKKLMIETPRSSQRFSKCEVLYV